ncbi:hypothetical protein KIL84_023190 [Mauremys mutica]|uniref:Uncharacterized protein n=1 Tax=Mauremys mutica TaxID=74926 RepID=A0A9D4ARA0_9SAUR|nr:hypothetical protein KIL84_023190 [Mauremys mutica]
MPYIFPTLHVQLTVYRQLVTLWHTKREGSILSFDVPSHLSKHVRVSNKTLVLNACLTVVCASSSPFSMPCGGGVESDAKMLVYIPPLADTHDYLWPVIKSTMGHKLEIPPI